MIDNEMKSPSPPHRICVFGPESTGKTSLAKALARHFRTKWVPEYVREVAAQQKNKVYYRDVVRVARGQVRRENILAKKARQFLFCDTDTLQTIVYSRHYFKKVPKEVLKLGREKRYALYLLCDIDLPWVPDPQRDLGHMRPQMFKKFRRELIKRKLPYVIIRGRGATRTRNAIRAITDFAR